LRVGVARLSATSPINGLRQLTQNLSVESLVRAGEDGRLQPMLAEAWSSSRDGRSLIVKLRSNVQFHDGSPLDATTVAQLLPDSLRSFLGALFPEKTVVQTAESGQVAISFEHPSPLLFEALEAPLQKPGPPPVGTGPFMALQGTSELKRNDGYYLGRPFIERLIVTNYPSIRTAWAELLRHNLDMLYEVAADAIGSLERSSTISTFTYTRHYQRLVILNGDAPALKSSEVRRALNMAVDRQALVKSALGGFGVPSSVPLPPHHWALGDSKIEFPFDPVRADKILRGHFGGKTLRFTCLVPADTLDERIALELKRQLASIGVEMRVEEASRDEILRRAGAGEYDAAVLEAVSGPTILRPYVFWHSKAPLHWGHFGNANIDAAFDRARNATTEDDYRKAAIGIQQAFVDDPPAIFLAWPIQARAVSNDFVVPTAESGRDVLSTLRLWRPAADNRHAKPN
jgi:peptide/nickel transport system substrate-binding protein